MPSSPRRAPRSTRAPAAEHLVGTSSLPLTSRLPSATAPSGSVSASLRSLRYAVGSGVVVTNPIVAAPAASARGRHFPAARPLPELPPDGSDALGAGGERLGDSPGD